MIVVNTETIPGKSYEVLSLVAGCAVLSKHIGKDFLSGIKNIAGGELDAYTELLEQSQTMAVQRMMGKAQNMGADAVVNVRFSTPSVTQGGAEIIASGTAVKFV